MSFVDKMKQRWGVGPWGVLAIVIVFALTGMTVVYLKRPILGYVLPTDAPRWQSWSLYALIVFPLYQVTLLAYGALFGQFRFFWEKEKAMVRAVGKGFRLMLSGRH